MTIKILLESLLRNCGNGVVVEEDILHVAGWTPDARRSQEFPFYPARVVMQDFTGVPAAVDLAAMRAAVARLGGDPRRVNPLVPVDLVIDHSVQVDFFVSERIHRCNLVGMGVLPLQFRPGETRRSLGLTGREHFDVRGIASGLRRGQELTVRATREDGSHDSFGVTVRIDTPIEIDDYRHGGSLPCVLRALITDTQGRTS